MTEYIKKTGTVVVGNSNKRILVTLDKIDNAKYKVYINGYPSDCTTKITIDGQVLTGKGGGPNRLILELKNGVYEIEASHPNCYTKKQTLTVDVGGTGIDGEDIYLDFKDEYLGLVDFVTTKELYDNVSTLLAPPPYDYVNNRTLGENEVLKYFKVKTYDGKIIYIPSGIAISPNKVSINDLVSENLLTLYDIDEPVPVQGKVVTIAGKKYRARLLSIDYVNRYDKDEFSSDFGSTEVSRLLKILDESSYKKPPSKPNVTISLFLASFIVSGPRHYNKYQIDPTIGMFTYKGWLYNEHSPLWFSFNIETDLNYIDYTPMIVFEEIK